jgi:hypothetical protein
MSAANAKLVLETLAGKTLDADQMKRLVELYLSDFEPVKNPYDPSDPDQVDDYNAWPTVNELGQMFLDRMRKEARKHVRSAARKDYMAKVESQAEAEEGQL